MAQTPPRLVHEVSGAIARYAQAYRDLEALQRQDQDLLPIGDQKTGVVGEFYSRLFARATLATTLEYGGHSQPGWDIALPISPFTKIQVKTVSSFSEGGRLSPIHPGWDLLYLVRLDDHLWPEGFWSLRRSDVDWENRTLSNRTMPRVERPGSGSAEFQKAENQLSSMLDVLSREGVARVG